LQIECLFNIFWKDEIEQVPSIEFIAPEFIIEKPVYPFDAGMTRQPPNLALSVGDGVS
tara:strand:+ start:438 stop:611 length:174 start_codon:yes stop_codon:yes gene_type:complete